VNRIVIAVDESDSAQDAVALGGHLARATGTPVTLAHVHPWGAAAVHLCEPYFTEQARVLLERLTALLGPVADLETCVVPGPSAVGALVGIAEDRAAGLIVVGSSHTGKPGRILPGSTAERLLHGALCPVAVVPVGWRAADGHGWNTIGCAWNGTADSDAGLDLAERLAQATGTALRVVRVVEQRQSLYPAELRLELLRFMAGVRDDARRALETKVADLSGRLTATGDFRDGEPVTELVAASQELDVLVIGSRGYGPLGAVMLGGVSGRLVRQASCPVIVHPNGARRPEARADTSHTPDHGLADDVILEGRATDNYGRPNVVAADGAAPCRS